MMPPIGMMPPGMMPPQMQRGAPGMQAVPTNMPPIPSQPQAAPAGPIGMLPDPASIQQVQFTQPQGKALTPAELAAQKNPTATTKPASTRRWLFSFGSGSK
jgi:hypothetical protein